ncbi:MAG: hypothetical protein Greene07147_531 [Parcubacteria group bacterium Greene0714_7]|nr:MAG: hypothetical protein Greene07147_531 [Parcubacteria group bacterium Greene0714_7]
MNETLSPNPEGQPKLHNGMKSKTLLFIGGVLVVIVALGGIAYFASKQKSSETNDNAINLGATTTPNYTIELEPEVQIKDLAPSLERGIHFGASVPEVARTAIQKNADVVLARLKKDLNRADDWFTLGVLYHSANDYEGAVGVWEFLLKVVPAPGVSTAYDNLGKLYKFDLKDFPKSESYLKQSIQVNPNSITAYFELHELYRYLYKQNTTLAVDILVSASKKFPANPDPLVMLGGYYRDTGDTEKARDAFTKALAIAREQNDVAHVESIGEELARLPQ